MIEPPLNPGIGIDMTAEEAARMLLGHIGGHGLERPGDFFAKLLDAMHHADPMNLHRLTVGYPRLGTVVRTYRYRNGGYEELCALAGVEPIREPWQSVPADTREYG